MRKMETVSFTFIRKFKDVQNKAEIESLLDRNREDLKTVYDNMNKYGKDKLISPSDSLILVHLNDNLIGLSCMTENSLISGYEEIENNLYIKISIIDEVFRFKGIGTLLYTEIESVNEHILNKPFLFRGTWVGNKVQHHLYTNFGFKKMLSRSQNNNEFGELTLYGKQVG